MYAAPNGEALVPLANIIAGSPSQPLIQAELCLFYMSSERTLIASPASTTAIVGMFPHETISHIK